MNTEQAIYAFEKLKQGISCNVPFTPTIEVIDVAIEALRAQQGRENQKPCAYCNFYPHKYLYVSDATEPRIFFDITGSNIRFFDEQYEDGFVDIFKINYCPMCGRKL